MSFDSLPFKQTKTVEATLAEVRAGKQYDDSDFCKKFCSYESLEAAEKLSKLFFNNDQSACKVADFKNNKLPNKLLYFGDLSTAKKQSEVLDELKKLNTKEANYFLAFHRSELEKDYTILNNLPEGIRYSGYAGKMMGDSEELKVIEAYKKGRITYSEMEEKISEAVNFEMLRQHGGIEIDEILFYGRPVIK